MRDQLRFGRRLPLPSTAQIIHELKMLILEDRIKDLEREIASERMRAQDPERRAEGEPCGTRSR